MNRWCAIIPGCLVLYVTSPGYAAHGALYPSSQPTGGVPPLLLLPTPVDPSESILSEYTPQAPPDRSHHPIPLPSTSHRYPPPANRAFLTTEIPLAQPQRSHGYLSLGGEIREHMSTIPARLASPGQPRNDDSLRRIADADLHVNDHCDFSCKGSRVCSSAARERRPRPIKIRLISSKPS